MKRNLNAMGVTIVMCLNWVVNNGNNFRSLLNIGGLGTWIKGKGMCEVQNVIWQGGDHIL